jgi:hypothetical protein
MMENLLATDTRRHAMLHCHRGWALVRHNEYQEGKITALENDQRREEIDTTITSAQEATQMKQSTYTKPGLGKV